MEAYCYILIYMLNKSTAIHCVRSQDLLIVTVPSDPTESGEGCLSMLLPLLGISYKIA